jgi:hypothetical protein
MKCLENGKFVCECGKEVLRAQLLKRHGISYSISNFMVENEAESSIDVQRYVQYTSHWYDKNSIILASQTMLFYHLNHHTVADGRNQWCGNEF